MNKKRMTYVIAGIRIHVISDELWELKDEGVLKDYVSDCDEWDVILDCHVVDELSKVQGICVYHTVGVQVYHHGNVQMMFLGCPNYAKITREGNCSHVEVKKEEIPYGLTSHFMLKIMELEHLLAMRDGILLHAVMIEADQEAILFTAPSQTGKSTQARLWCELKQARLINGDRAAVVVKKDVIAFGIPFSGSSDVRENVQLPLKAIVYLKQSDKNEAVLLRGVDAFRRIYEGCSVQSFHQNDVTCVMDTVMRLIEKVPVILLNCRADEDAVHVLSKKLKEVSV